MSGALANFPVLSQKDGNVNSDWDCVPASIAASLVWLTGKRFTAGQIKDAVYGPGYTGATAAVQYVPYCRSQSIRLYPIADTNQNLISYTLLAIKNGCPVLFTEPDPYSKIVGASHVVVAYSYTDTSITVMDPFIASNVVKSISEWTASLLFQQVWILERMIPVGWTDNGSVLLAPNGRKVQHGFRDYVLNHTWDKENVPVEAEFGANPVVESDPMSGQGVRQTFRDGMLVYTASRGSYVAYTGQELQAVRTNRDTLKTQVAALQEQVKTLQAVGAQGSGPGVVPDSIRQIAQQILTLVNPLLQ